MTQLRLLLVSLIRINILLYAISWNLREIGVGKKWGRRAGGIVYKRTLAFRKKIYEIS